MAPALAILAVCAAVAQLGSAAKLPPSFKRCTINDAANKGCLIPAVQQAFEFLKDGHKPLAIPPLDPLYVENMILDLGNGPIQLVLNARNMNVSGLYNSVVTDAKLDPATHTLFAEALSKHIRLDFLYNADGRILLVPVKGDGPGFFEFEDMISKHTISGKMIEKKGKKYFDIEDYKVELPEPKGMKVNFEGLMKGDPRISEQLNKFLNTEWKAFYTQIKRPAEDAFGAIFKEVSSRLFSRVPYKDVFLDYNQ